MRPLFQTDQSRCYDGEGNVIDCAGTGQDGALRQGLAWPAPRFRSQGKQVFDRMSGLTWAKDASMAEFPLSWEESFAFVRELNRQKENGANDWRLPRRGELFSLISHARTDPALPADHPFENVFPGYYWTATPCARLPRQAWYTHMGGGRVFKGMKHGSYMLWPVRGDIGYAIPEPRFVEGEMAVFDRHTGLSWTKNASLGSNFVTWEQALERIRQLNQSGKTGRNDWRLPNIRELESLCDLAFHSPALTHPHPFHHVQAAYWSGTSSAYDPSYAWVLYLEDGAIGVGYKPKPEFALWPVSSGMNIA